MNKPIVFILIATTVLLGCSNPMGSSNKPHFYEYDGGMINLSTIVRIYTSAQITISVEPRAPKGEFGTERRALWEAHEVFCGTMPLPAQYNDGIVGSANFVKIIGEGLAEGMTSEILQTCAITIKSRAMIVLDNFRIEQEEGSFTLPADVGSYTDEKSIRNFISSSISSNVTQPAAWEREYEALREQVAL